MSDINETELAANAWLAGLSRNTQDMLLRSRPEWNHGRHTLLYAYMNNTLSCLVRSKEQENEIHEWLASYFDLDLLKKIRPRLRHALLDNGVTTLKEIEILYKRNLLIAIDNIGITAVKEIAQLLDLPYPYVSEEDKDEVRCCVHCESKAGFYACTTIVVTRFFDWNQTGIRTETAITRINRFAQCIDCESPVFETKKVSLPKCDVTVSL